MNQVCTSPVEQASGAQCHDSSDISDEEFVDCESQIASGTW